MRDADCMADGKTQLASPQPSVIASLSPGDELDIVFTDSGACNAVYRGKIAGSIVGVQLARIIDCMNKGHRFIAIVRTVDGAKCAVTIKNTAS